MNEFPPEKQQVIDAVLAAHMPRVEHLRREIALLTIEHEALFKLSEELKEMNKHIESDEVIWDDLYWKWSEFKDRYHAQAMASTKIALEKANQVNGIIDLMDKTLREHGLRIERGGDGEWPEFLDIGDEDEEV